MNKKGIWLGKCDLVFEVSKTIKNMTLHHSNFTAPYKLMKTTNNADGRSEIPLLHTAGGLVGGDELILNVRSKAKSRGFITTVAAQKVYGTVGRSNIHPEGLWSRQFCNFTVEEDGDLEWFPQEIVMFEGGLFEQTMRVKLHPGASFLSTEIVRLGRTAAGEKLGNGCWRSKVEIARITPESSHWEFIDQLELSGKALVSTHGLANQPVFGSLIWIAPENFSNKDFTNLIHICRSLKKNINGSMSCSILKQGISARYLGVSTQAARSSFLRIWSEIRKIRNLSSETNLRVWPLQENI
tara:strand:- start:25171 stop:26061 length:891 start_codon:yes stop_codon:yes gene_type:complete